MNQAQITMNGGEISPLLHHRSDLEKHSSSLAQCRNFIPLPYGGVRKRPGTECLLSLGLEEDIEHAIIRHFKGSDGKQYILVFAWNVFQAYDIANDSFHEQVVYWNIPNAAAMQHMRITSVNDVFFLTSPDIYPQTLSYTDATTWTFKNVAFKNDPYLDENLAAENVISIVSEPPATTWTSGVSVTAGEIRLITENGTAREYIATKSHTTDSAKKPGSGDTWRLNWRVMTYPAGTIVRLIAFPGISAWVTSTAYKKNSFVSYGGNAYRCKLDHTSSGSSIPGLEAAAAIASWQLCKDPFDADHVAYVTAYVNTFPPAAKFKLRIARDEKSNVSELRAISSNDGQTSTPILISGSWNFTTFGTWSGLFTLERSTDNGSTWSFIGSYESEADRNVSAAFEETSPALVRMKFTKDGSTGASGQQRGVIDPGSIYVDSFCAIDTVTTSRIALGKTQSVTISGSTDLWSESAFNRVQGFPITAVIHERRLFFAGTQSKPLTIWGSVIEDFYNFAYGSKDDEAFTFTLSAAIRSPILWLSSQRRLFIGTEYTEWVIGNDTNDHIITPTNFLARQYTTYGSADMAPINIGDSVVFIQRHGNRIREMAYQSETESYDSADLTRLAGHLFSDANQFEAADATPRCIKQVAWQQSREPILWVVLNNGTLLTFSYSRQERINAWAKHDTVDGEFKGVCVAPNEADDDSIYFIVKRVAYGGHLYTLERITGNSVIRSEFATDAATPNQEFPAVFDCQINITTGLTPADSFPVHPILGLPLSYVAADQYYNEEIVIWTDADYVPGFTETRYIHGYPITGEIVSLPLETALQTGSSISKKKRIHKILAHLHYGRALEIRQNYTETGAETYAAAMPAYEKYAQDASVKATDTKLYSGWVCATTQISGTKVQAKLFHDAPTTCTITAMIAEFEVNESR